MAHVSSFNYTHPTKNMHAIEVQFIKNKSRFKSLHFEDQVVINERILKVWITAI